MAAHDGGSRPRTSRTVRLWLIFLTLVGLGEGAVIFALTDPLGAKDQGAVTSQGVRASASPSPSTTRPGYQFPSSSDKPVDGSLQCPDAGSVAAGKGDDKTQVLTLKGSAAKPVMLLGPNRRVIVAKDAVMVGPVIMCGDGATLLIIGTMQGQVVIRGNGVKIVVQDGDKNKLPPAYSTSNGTVLICTTSSSPATPHCDNYRPRPGVKPGG